MTRSIAISYDILYTCQQERGYGKQTVTVCILEGNSAMIDIRGRQKRSHHCKATMKYTLICFIVAAVTTACATKTLFNAGNVTRPVLLGNSSKLVGPDSIRTQLKANFEVNKGVSSNGFNETRDHWSGGDKADAELLRLADSPQDTIRVNEVTFNSGSAFILIPGYLVAGVGVIAGSSVGINGGIYRIQESGHNDAR